jgi:hypothetical protein
MELFITGLTLMGVWKYGFPVCEAVMTAVMTAAKGK